MRHVGKLPDKLDVVDPRLHQEQVAGTVAEHLVGEMDLAVPRERGYRNHHVLMMPRTGPHKHMAGTVKAAAVDPRWLPADHFDRLAADAEAVRGELSESKQVRTSQEQANERFPRGLLLLNALMDAPDEGCLR